MIVKSGKCPDLKNSRLSWGARGMLAYLLSKPQSWEPRNYDLFQQTDDSEYTNKKFLKELKEAGHLHREYVSDGRGGLKCNSTIYENPADNPHYVPKTILTLKEAPDTLVETSPSETAEQLPLIEQEVEVQADFTLVDLSPDDNPGDIVTTSTVSSKHTFTTENKKSAKAGSQANKRGRSKRPTTPEQMLAKEDALYQLFGYFFKRTNLRVPDVARTYGHWLVKVRSWLKAVDGDLSKAKRLIDEAVTWLNERGCIIGSPYSLDKTVNALVAKLDAMQGEVDDKLRAAYAMAQAQAGA